MLATGLVRGSLFIAGLVLFTKAYVGYREIQIQPVLPERAALPLVGAAGTVPLLLVCLTKVVGSVIGIPYTSLRATAVAADASTGSILLLLGLRVLLIVPVLVLVCQVLVQESFERVLDRDIAIGLTAVLTGFVMVSNTGGLTIVPDEGTLAGAVLFAIVLALALYVNDRNPRDQLRYLAYVPLILVTTTSVVVGISMLESIAGLLFTVTHYAVFAVAADSHDRNNSLLAPAVAYVMLVLANSVVMVIFEAGGRAGSPAVTRRNGNVGAARISGRSRRSLRLDYLLGSAVERRWEFERACRARRTGSPSSSAGASPRHRRGGRTPRRPRASAEGDEDVAPEPRQLRDRRVRRSVRSDRACGDAGSVVAGTRAACTARVPVPLPFARPPRSVGTLTTGFTESAQ
jgi:hypothetical protein